MRALLAFSVVFALSARGPVAGRPRAVQQIAGPSSATAAAPSSTDPKAQVLCRMARWQWQLKKPGQPLPVLDSSNVEAFRKSAFNSDKTSKPSAGIGVLYDSVQARLKARKLTFGKATPADLGTAIGAVLIRQYRGKPEARQAAAFAATLAGATVAKANATTTSEPSDSNKTAATLPLNTSAKPTIANPPTAEAQSETAGFAASASPIMPFWLWLLAGMGLGAASCYYWLSGSHQRELRRRERQAVLEKEQRAERRKTRDQYISSLEHKILALEDVPAKPPASGKRPPAQSAPALPVLPIEADESPVPTIAPDSERTIELAVAPTAPPAPTRYYAPAPDVPYIEHRKLSAEPLGVMPVRLVVDGGPAGTRATYGFSPEADQGRIITAGVRNLRAFFDFELPPSEQINSITTHRPGRLERVGERWEVREKAQLDIQ